MQYTLEFKWTVSRGRDTYGYNICSLWLDGRKVASCNGGGYDMQGTVLGDWIAARFAEKLLGLQTEFYGLTFHDPNFDPGKAIIGQDTDNRTLAGENANGKTVNQAEADGESLGLERYQAFYRASSRIPTERHTVPLIDGACGFSSVERIVNAIGLTLEFVPTRSFKRNDIYILRRATEALGDPGRKEEAWRSTE